MNLKDNNFSQIAFDQRWIGEHGIGRFAREVASRLNFYHGVPLKTSPVHPADCLFLSILLARRGRIFFYSPGYNVPLYAPGGFAVTIHDLNHLDCRDNSTVLKRSYYRMVLRPACRQAVLVFTVSEFSRQRILDWSGIDSNRVVSVGNGVSEAFSPVGSRVKMDRPFFLMVSNRKGHKNETGALSGFAISGCCEDFLFVFTGKPSPTLLNQAKTLGVINSIRFLGLVSEPELAALYRGATALVFPSFYEGFGLPIVEAMACGCPVVTSNMGAMREVAGVAALFVDPAEAESIGGAIRRVADDHCLADALGRIGIDTSKNFSWDRTANIIGQYLAKSI